MIRRFFPLITLFAVTHVHAQAPDWENPQVVGINKRAYHATLTRPSERATHPEWLSLDGRWRFH